MDESITFTNIKRFVVGLIIALGSSGIIIHAIYVYGQVYYQGYIKRLGFDYVLFPVSSLDSYLWAYGASLYGVSTVLDKNQYFYSALGIVVFSGFILGLFLWHSTNQRKPDTDGNKQRAGKLEYAGLGSIGAIWLFLLLITLIALWLAFPILANDHGRSVATKNLETWQSDLCAKSESNPWDWCIQIEYREELIHGRLIFRNGHLLGIYTADGPVTVSMPDNFYFLREHLE